MAGGLINIVNYGAQDLYLTGEPEVTFFKLVYRRYTNFSTESIKIPFKDPVQFGKKASFVVPRNGDLIGKCELEIDLPKVAITRKGDAGSSETQSAYNTALDNYNKTKIFMRLNIAAYREAYNEYLPVTNTTSAEMITAIQTYFATNDPSETIQDDMEAVMVSLDMYNYDAISMLYQADINNSTDKDQMFNIINISLGLCTEIQKTIYDNLVLAKEANDEENKTNLKFAWINRLGHFIFKYIQISVGGYKVDRHYGQWIDIWYELSGNKRHKENYMKMIGDVSEMTTFDRNPKPAYKLRIPLQFWFCRFNGLALPIIAIESPIRFTIDFRELSEVAYIEEETSVASPDQIYLEDLQDDQVIYMDAAFNINYIFLDNKERKRFAQSSHEYMIEQMQMLEFKDVTSLKKSSILDYYHPAKFIVWIAQKESLLVNEEGYTETRRDKYDLDSGANPIKCSRLMYDSYDKMFNITTQYFNDVETLKHFRNIPPVGINVFVNSLKPEEFQPTGTVNYANISQPKLTSTFQDELQTSNTGIDPMRIRIFCMNLNVFRVAGGYGRCAFVTT